MKANEFLEAYNEVKNRFKVIEHFNGYAVEDTITGEEAWMSDGVDVFDDERGLEIGTEEFRKAWEDDLNNYPSETLEAYFPEQYAKENESLLEWHCPKCDNDEIPDEDRECPNCGFMVPKEMNDRIREVYGKIYDKVFSKIRSKLLEDELQGTNVLKFVNTLSRLGVIKRLRSGRYEETYKIPKEFVVSAFVEGKSGLPRLRRMVLRRQKRV